MKIKSYQYNKHCLTSLFYLLPKFSSAMRELVGQGLGERAGCSGSFEVRTNATSKASSSASGPRSIPI